MLPSRSWRTGEAAPSPPPPSPPPTTRDGRDTRDALSDSGELVTSIGGFLIELPERKIVVDTGIGPVEIDFPSFGPFSGGAFLGSLASTGVDPADVMDVVFTHLHLDHVGWTTTKRGRQPGGGRPP